MKRKTFSYITYFLCLCTILEILFFAFSLGNVEAYENVRFSSIMGAQMAMFICIFANYLVKTSNFIGKYEIGMLFISASLILYIGRYLFLT